MQAETVLVDRYQIREQLSRKAGRRVFLAQDLQSQDLVIIKILRFDADFQWDDLKLFEREVATLKNLDHPAIPKYLDYFEVEEVHTRGFALVQTYINAPSLEHAVKEGRKFSESELIELADRLLSILLYLHELNPPVIHRDIKPSNILLTNRSGNSIGDVYLVDFGSVQTATSKDIGTITIVGSYGYMPLEQFGGQTNMASDLYSLGMTIIYLLTGTHPAELPQVNGKVKFTAEISGKLYRWLEKITQPHLEKRFDTAKSAQIALQSEDGSYGDFIHLKPANSQIKLYRNQHVLEVQFYVFFDSRIVEFLDNCFASFILVVVFKGVQIGIPIGILLYIFAIIFQSLAPAIVNLFGLVIGLVLLSVPYLVISFLLYFLPIRPFLVYLQTLHIKSSDKYTVIRFKEDQMIKTRRSSEHKRKQNPIIKLSNISSIIYNPGYTFDKYWDVDSQSHQRGRVDVKPELRIIAATGQYTVEGDFTQAELLWLGRELSDFLNLELQIIYSTPEVPSNKSDDD
jgi:serine/threonine protein kinase